MGITAQCKPQDWAGLALAALLGGGAFAFRQLAIVPRATVGICAATAAPGWCVPRGWVLHWQYLGSFGWAALAVGLLAFVWGQRIIAGLAIGLGIAAVVNYNGTQGIIGAALGLVAWLSLLTRRPGWARG
ncbi:MAG: hypothetical protein KGQ26_10625 [Rhodospirillales bacterium]|nr:hypothetical protein [Rhodospirillales bacterium]MDE2318209.1 hypothetical protein [Rhodospirillales bacterium]